MKTLIQTAAIVAAITLASGALAAPAPATHPVFDPTIGLDGPVANPGEPFLPSRGIIVPRGGDIVVNPYQMACFVSPTLYGPEGQAYLVYKNTGNTVIPAGTWIEVKLSNGKTMKYKVGFDLQPGDAMYGYVPDDILDLSFDCSVHTTTA